jgi:heme o synthase
MTDNRSRHPALLSTLLELTRVRVTVAVTFTTATGYFLAARPPYWNIWLPVLGVFLLASGASALNQCQDAALDARMNRTRRRPIPAGHVNISTALFVAVLLIMLGFATLASIEDADLHALLALGAFAVLWYNGIYTYLKRVTAFAVVPGALIGAIPPLIGYVAAGGWLTAPLILLVGTFFFIWQIPHFWLLLLLFGKQYSDAGLPSLSALFAPPQLARVTFVWVLATAVSGLIFPAFGRDEMSLPWSLGIVLGSLWLGYKALALLNPAAAKDAHADDAADEDTARYRRAFMQINVYALLIMLCLTFNALGWNLTS